jgi:hypothetical protein
MQDVLMTTGANAEPPNGELCKRRNTAACLHAARSMLHVVPEARPQALGSMT